MDSLSPTPIPPSPQPADRTGPYPLIHKHLIGHERAWTAARSRLGDWWRRLMLRGNGKEVLEAINRRRASAVVMLKLDRGLRSAGDCLTTVERWGRIGVALRVVDLGGNAIDTTSAGGRGGVSCWKRRIGPPENSRLH